MKTYRLNAFMAGGLYILGTAFDITGATLNIIFLATIGAETAKAAA